MKCGQLDDLIALGFKQRNSGNDERVTVLLDKPGKAGINFAFCTGPENINSPAKCDGRVLKGFQLVSAGDKTRVYQRSNGRRVRKKLMQHAEFV